MYLLTDKLLHTLHVHSYTRVVPTQCILGYVYTPGTLYYRQANYLYQISIPVLAMLVQLTASNAGVTVIQHT